ncbi:toll/interleukin-1 receptor domain-containing protein [Parachryseolinea silvisoli]|uniref:toll/interleukin-1 receptor domain-containing protein n=1 Tax=Parachryseolinea silvisoli TaxID=2873601 RepID=UPI0022659602|nr:toll/interleukin-1 receptor domain-containing protein [Parachryseolinea silvisoli]MCD9015429.1 toll/interleukin-1 receptor domain-containing protein [Parachryseolinea silvisoli]
MAKAKYRYDVFISHAVEDKIPIVNALDTALRAKGLEVWYSGKELSIGDQLTQTIYQGLNESQYGVVILSPTYLRKAWAMDEFFQLIRRQQEGVKVVLPVLYDITPEELAARYPPMADLVSVSASVGVEIVVNKIYEVIQGEAQLKKLPVVENIVKSMRHPRIRLLTLMVAFIVLSVAVAYGLFLKIGQRPPSEFIDHTVEQRIASLQRRADQRLRDLTYQLKTAPATTAEASALYDLFWNTTSHYRNEYMLVMPEKEISGRRAVEMRLHQAMKEFTPANNFFMLAPQVYVGESSYIFYNTHPIRYTTTTSAQPDGRYEITVTYTEGIRMVYTKLEFPTSASDTKRHQVMIQAFPPTETYAFVQKGEVWELQEIR